MAAAASVPSTNVAEALDDAGEAKLPNKDAKIRGSSNLEMGFVRTQTRLQINSRILGDVVYLTENSKIGRNPLAQGV
jgi:hypothetical protein